MIYLRCNCCNFYTRLICKITKKNTTNNQTKHRISCTGGGIFFTFYKYFNYLGIDWMITMQKLSHYYHATATLLLCYGNTVIVLRQHGCSATAT